jgi:hypothetical protein
VLKAQSIGLETSDEKNAFVGKKAFYVPQSNDQGNRVVGFVQLWLIKKGQCP